MRDKLLRLEKISRFLEPDETEREYNRGKVITYSETFLNSIESTKAFVQSADSGSGLLYSPISENSIGIEEAISLIRENVDTPGLNPASGGHLAYIPGGG